MNESFVSDFNKLTSMLTKIEIFFFFQLRYYSFFDLIKFVLQIF